MQVVILAAGLGQRLGDMTVATPKALIEVAGHPLVHYAIAFARAAGGRDLHVVGGFCHQDVVAFVAAEAPDAHLIENGDFRKGNLLSLHAAIGHLARDRGCLVMNTDHVYRPAIAGLVAEVAASATSVTAFCDFDRKLGVDDMKVQLDGSRHVVDMAKTLEQWDCGYVGMTFVPASHLNAYVAAVERVRTSVGDRAVVEQVLVNLADSGEAVAIADISGHGWLEIDEPHERRAAEDVLAAEHWWA